MEAFSQKDYYPIPSDNVITYDGENNDQSKKRRVLKADLLALIVQLSSPIDTVDYMVISDFFLIYRNFVSPMELSDLLVMRYRWCVSEIDSESLERRKIGEIALVRTFVLLRHWILNYFVQTFLPDGNLRLRVIKFLNEPCESRPKIVKSTMINLKKAWIICSKRVWTNLSLNEPSFKRQDNHWVTYEIVDYTRLDEVCKRDSRLSAYAKNGSSSPNFRNQSVLSLFKDSVVFKIPETNNRASRTASMVLFPCDNSNIKTENGKKTVEKSEAQPDNKRIMSNFSKMTNIPDVIKDVQGSVSPNIDKLIPPTPAKKVELIFQVPDNVDRPINKDQIEHTEHTSQKQSGPIALLHKWKKIHTTSRDNCKHAQLSETSGLTKPEVENFVKYVISITSLENKTTEPDNLHNLIASKFDILSARTIEEVEFLVSLENELVNQVKDAAMRGTKIPINETVQELERVRTNDQGFSAMDNLNLYHTVSSIAKSVTSLTNSLNQRPKVQNNTLSPSHAALERRKVQSSVAAMLSSDSRCSLISRTNSGKGITLNQLVDGPQRLVFHDITSSNQEKENNGDNLSFRKSGTQSPTRSSPLRNNLPCLAEDPLFSTRPIDRERGSIVSISTCSQLSTSSLKRSDEESLLSVEVDNHGLKRKVAQSNLREFTFENQQEIDTKGRDSVSSFVTTRETIEETPPMTKKFPVKGVRPASGRISLMRKQSSVPLSPQNALLSKAEAAIKDLDFQEKEAELLQSEIEMAQLQKQTALRLSMAASVNTDVLFASQHNSPQKMIMEDDSSHIKLSTTPSVRSVNRGTSVSTKMTTDSMEESAEAPAHSSLKDELRRLEPEVSVESSFGFPDLNVTDPFSEGENSTGMKNKYLFSPDGESVDLASPAKNVEEIKDKFLNKEEDDEESEPQEVPEVANDLTRDAEKAIIDLKKKALDQENVVNIASLPDDSIHDDPVNVALMKLEGTYKRNGNGEEEEIDGSKSSSVLAREVDVLGIKDLSVPPVSPADRRRSLLIEKRRQTITNFPFTPSDEKEYVESQPANVKQLLKNYELRDPNLLISNSELHVPFILMYDSLSIAQQMTLIEREILGEVDWNELLNLNLSHSPPQATSWLQLLVQNESLSGINLAISRFNLTVDWVISEIVLTSDVKLRRNTIQRFIHVAEHCRVFQNYNTMMEIVLALGSTAVQRSSEAWRLIEPGDLITWEELRKIPSLDRNYSAIRSLLNNVDPLKGCVPFIVIYLSDISLNSEKKNWIVMNQVVNYNKFNTNVQIVKNFIQRVQWSKFYNFTVDHELLSKCVYLTALSPDEITQLTG